MKHSAKRLLSLVLGLGLMVAAFIIFVSFTRPAYEEIQEIRNQKYTFDLELENKKQAIQDVATLIEEHKSDTDFNETVSLHFPTSPNLSSALAQIHSLAVDIAKLTLTSVNVSESGSQVSRSSGGARANGTSLERPIHTISFDLSLIGSYSQLKNFIDKVETNIRIFDVESVSLNPAASGTKVPLDLFNYQVKVVTYYQGEE
ncbi:MAG: hypothetical protein AAB787_03175 [Patescibacteria group bacterium]